MIYLKFLNRGEEKNKTYNQWYDPVRLWFRIEEEIVIFPKRHVDGQQAHEKMLPTTNHQENAPQKQCEISPHTC